MQLVEVVNVICLSERKWSIYNMYLAASQETSTERESCQWCNSYKSYNWWNISISLSTLRICLCESYHLTRPPSQQLCSQISLSLMRCKFTNCHSNEMQFKHVIPHVITLKYPITWIQRLISSLYHSYKLKHTQHDFHNLNKRWVLLDYPQTTLKKRYKSLV